MPVVSRRTKSAFGSASIVLETSKTAMDTERDPPPVPVPGPCPGRAQPQPYQYGSSYYFGAVPHLSTGVLMPSASSSYALSVHYQSEQLAGSSHQCQGTTTGKP